MPHDLHLLLLRHGETDSNAAGIVQGHLPVPLNELGRRQAAALAARLKAFTPRIGRLISSDLPRATQTAQPIAAALDLSIELDAQWRERFLGDHQGKAIGERRTWSLASGEETPPGAESLDDFSARVRSALEAIRVPQDGGPVAVVTHGGPCRVVLRMLVDGTLPIDGDRPADAGVIPNCSILELHRSQAGLWRVACVNDAAHVAGLSSATARDAG